MFVSETPSRYLGQPPGHPACPHQVPAEHGPAGKRDEELSCRYFRLVFSHLNLIEVCKDHEEGGLSCFFTLWSWFEGNIFKHGV